MDYLVKVGGELYIPAAECENGVLHYAITEFEPVQVLLTSQTPLRSALIKLVKHELRRAQETDDWLDERVNLCHDINSDEEPIVSLADICNRREFELFVQGKSGNTDYAKKAGVMQRFSYNKGTIFAQDIKVEKNARVQDFCRNQRGFCRANFSYRTFA